MGFWDSGFGPVSGVLGFGVYRSRFWGFGRSVEAVVGGLGFGGCGV